MNSHLTAMRRTSGSVPCRRMLSWRMRYRFLFLSSECGRIRCRPTVLDYGCGHGEDVRYLNKHGFRAQGYDPNFSPELPNEGQKFDIVMCVYVLNILETPEDRMDVINKAWSFVADEGMLFLAARSLLSITKLSRGWTAKGDGWITGRNTFQHGMTNDELRELVTRAVEPPFVVYRINKAPFAGVVVRKPKG